MIIVIFGHSKLNLDEVFFCSIDFFSFRAQKLALPSIRCCCIELARSTRFIEMDLLLHLILAPEIIEIENELIFDEMIFLWFEMINYRTPTANGFGCCCCG